MATTTGGDPIRLAIIVGTTRKGRASDRFLPWLLERAGGHGAFSAGYSIDSVRR